MYRLKIDHEFKSLIRPPSSLERETLENNILADGCREPLVVWNEVIVDGHNRYEICCRHGIPFAIEEKEFSCREEAIAWICSNQLGRRNISEETRKFLIGKQYNAEKVVGYIRNKRGINQYDPEIQARRNADKDAEEEKPETRAPTSRRTAEKLANDHHIAAGTVQKYARFARAVEKIDRTEPELAEKLLTGECRISQENVVALAEMEPKDIKRFKRRMDKLDEPFAQFKVTRQEFNRETTGAAGRSTEPISGPSIKDMPQYDPDAEVVGLTLTIPSWCGSIDRARRNTQLETVSDAAKNNLKDALEELWLKVSEVLEEIGGKM